MSGRAVVVSTWLVAFLLAEAPAYAQTQDHLEACTPWNVEKGKVGFWNKCGQPVVVNFMPLNAKQPITRTIKPDARFDTSRTPAALKATGWMSTRCAAGYIPDIPFKAEMKEKIIGSQYQCVKG